MKAIAWIETKTGLTFAGTQRQAIGLALSSKVLVITGGPGVGKTTLVNAILKILTAKGVEIALAAPTGRAAKRLAETTGFEANADDRIGNASLFSAASGGGVRWGVAAAVMILATLPPLLLGLFMYRQAGKSLAIGAVKG